MSSPSPTRRYFPRWLTIVGWSLLGLLGAAMMAGMPILVFGTVQGTEFSPQLFERRTYWVIEVPLLGRQLSGIRRKDVSQAAELFVVNQKYITPAPAGVKEDWHIIEGSRGLRQTKGDSRILMQYLDAKDGDDYHHWVKWSEEHPKLAPVLWRGVQVLAIHELYIFVPDLFELAKSIEDPIKLRQELDRAVAGKLLFLGRRLIEREKPAQARSVLAEAAALDAENQEIREAAAKVGQAGDM